MGGLWQFIYSNFGEFTPFRGKSCTLGGGPPVAPGTGQGDVGYRLKKTVALVGMMGAGKTAVGNALARTLGVPFVDSDEEIERAANMTVAEIFARDGEPFFREKETQVLSRLLAGRPCILSTGGGAFLREVNREAIEREGVAVWLCADLDLLWQRVRHKTTRPLLRTANPRETLRELLEARSPYYRLARVQVTTQPEFSVEETTGRVIAALLEHDDILERTTG